MRAKILFLAVCIFTVIIPRLGLSEQLGLNELLKIALSNNPEIAVFKSRADAENDITPAKYTLSSPKLGVMRETNLSFMQQQMGPMQSWQVSQEIMFPTKYFTMGSMQRAKADAVFEEYLDKKLEIRQKALTLYFNYYSALKIQALLQAQKETLREISRLTETRRATGSVPQQDEMKAHVEQTKIENEILLQDQDVFEAKSQLNALLNREQTDEIKFEKDELPKPNFKLESEPEQKTSIKNSKMISSLRANLDEAETAHSLALSGYLPDFMLSYRKPFGANAPGGGSSVGIEVTLPLWFLTKESSEVSAATSKVMEAEKRLELAKRQTEAEVKSLAAKAKTVSNLLQIYETSLIPQAASTLNSSRAAYSAGRVGFQELLDAEKTLYSVRIDYYMYLAKFVEAVAKLERTSGQSFSDLPMNGG